MGKEKHTFCPECRKECSYSFKKVMKKCIIKEKEYDIELTRAFCNDCGMEINVPGIIDLRTEEMDRQFREKEDIVSISDIETLMEIYNIGKAPASLALGFGEITVTRYLQGQVPSKEYSDIIKKALKKPGYMIECLNKAKEKIGETAYKKALKCAEELKELFSLSGKLLSSISYIFEKTEEITPLALQKMLYYIQGIHMVNFGQPLFVEDCQAWTHGPAYKEVYELFKTFKYSPIEDKRFAILRDRFKELTEDEIATIDLVLNSFGLYSGKTLEIITHKEEPWIHEREGLLPDEPSNNVISKDEIKQYFDKVNEKFSLNDVEEIKKYIAEQIKVC
ncbi:MAG: DUF4065 domain-containing protein [Firmicutes bacterium]|nr:DUF4065 domain-containing protein [Bacillota bacterium]